MRELPTGTVTFLFTDIEGSTRLLEELGERYVQALAEHRRIVLGELPEVDRRDQHERPDQTSMEAPLVLRSVGASLERQHLADQDSYSQSRLARQHSKRCSTRSQAPIFEQPRLVHRQRARALAAARMPLKQR